MKVKELIEKLQKFDPELPVYCYDDHYDSLTGMGDPEIQMDEGDDNKPCVVVY